MSNSSARIGIIGTRWGRVHIGGFRGAGAQIAALCGRDPASTQAIAAQEGIPLATTDIEELCRAVDIVVVSGPDELHHAHIHAALDAGCHVLSEKPLTRTAEDAMALAARAKDLASTGRVCAVSFPYRMVPPMIALERWLHGREPAQWLTVTLRSSFAAQQAPGPDGPLAIMGASGDFGGASHVVDAGLWLMRGQPIWVEATFAGRPAHSLAMHIGLSTSAVITLSHLAAHEPGISASWHFLGSGWEARFAGAYRPAWRGWRLGPAETYDGTWTELASRVEPEPGRIEPWAGTHTPTARAFLAAVAKQPYERLASFDDGALVQRVFAAAMQSEREGKRVWLDPA